MNTKALRQKILDLAIHGKLVPQDPNDEPASVLLERIKAEKERLIKEGKIKRSKQSKTACDKLHYPFELPEGWCWTMLCEVTSAVGDGLHGTPQYDSLGTYFFINGNNLANRKIIIKEETKRISNAEYIKYRKPLNESTILVSINGTIGNVGTYNGENVILGKSACYFNLLPFISKDYICNIIESDYFRKYALKSATGSTIKNVPLKAINNFYIPMPPLQEQKRIVESIEHWLSLVDYIDEDKENLQETIKQAKSKILDLAIHGKLVPQDPTDEPACELLKRINPKAEITCDNPQYGKLPNGWCLCNLASLCKIKGGKRIPRGRTFSKGRTPHIYIRVSDMKNNTIMTTDLKYIDDDIYQTIKNYTISSSDLYLTIAGTIGAVGIVPTQFDGMNLTENAAKLTSIICDKKYLLYSLLSSTAQEHFKSRFHQVAQPKLSIETANSTIVCLPPLNEQHRIVAKIEELFAQLDNIASSL